VTVRRAAGIVLELLLIAGSMAGAGYLAQQAIQHGDGERPVPVTSPIQSTSPSAGPTP
jgi:hypothetical protein